MRRKYNDDYDDEENEFDVDEPEAIQNNGSDDDWTPELERDSGQGRRQSSRLRSIPKLKQPIFDASSSEDDVSPDEDILGNGKKSKSKGKPGVKGRRGRPPAKKSKTASSPVPTATPTSTNSEKTSSDPENSNSNSSTNAAGGDSSTMQSGSIIKVHKDFSSGAFLVLKSDFINSANDPPIWKIDGKALLQKYIPFVQDGKTLYKNTSVYSGWTINNKNNYYPITVIFKQQSRKEHVVEFQRDLVKVEETVTSD